nr:hypothetical protein BaRGS_020549 [Batillaria attramentaria]
MGCEIGKPSVVNQAQEDPEVECTGFSDTQIDTIRSTWPLLARDSQRVAVEVFRRIFREAPSIHSLFHSFNVEDLHKSVMFREHAGRFMLILQSLVDNLEAPSNIDDQLLILGAKHATFDGYHPEYFRFYTKCMLEVWEQELGEEFIHEVRDSWRLAFDYIVDRMTEGFDMCLSGQIQEVLNGSMQPANGDGRGTGSGEWGAGEAGPAGMTDIDDGLVRVQ